jgi:DNA polymerase I
MISEIVTQDRLAQVINGMNNCEVIALDCETNITDKFSERRMLCFTAYVPETDQAFYFSVGYESKLDFTGVKLSPKKVIWHNGKFDRPVFKKCLEWDFDDIPTEDTMLMSYVLDESPPHDLDALSKRHLSVGKTNKDMLKTLTKAFTWEGIPESIMFKYAIEDPILTFKLFQALNHRLQIFEPAQVEIYEYLLKLSVILQHMEEHGIQVDLIEARLKSAQCAERMQELKDGLGYDPAKPTELGMRLYGPNGLGLTPIEVGAPTKTFPQGRPAMGAGILEKYHHPEILKVLEYRRVAKAKTSYYDSWPKFVGDDNRMHPTYHLHGTVTGRLSCANPNMQNIPRDSEENLTKSQFPPKKLLRCAPDKQLWEFDYNQQELRLATIYAERNATQERKTMTKTFTEGKDPHQLMADSLHVSRFIGKVVNFLLPYGGGPDRLLATINTLDPELKFTFAEAKATHAAYHNNYPLFRQTANACGYAAETNEFITYWSGRKRRLKWDFHKAFNSLIQGGCADITFNSMIKLTEAKLSSVLIAQVHDSLWFEVEDTNELETIQAIMEWPTEFFNFPFPVEMKQIA